MANDAVVDKGRRRFLTATTAVVGGAGAAVAAIPFIKSWEP
ncbi:MAG: twin-arginine translocation signal domain-containing protein, partial [Dokdonella sp.]|nr:twin-arginine translocation signal domain-containing protein [Dokdonella sp.]